MHWIGWGYDGSMDAIIVSPSGNTSLANIKELANIVRCVFKCDKPEGALLQVLADVAKDHGSSGIC